MANHWRIKVSRELFFCKQSTQLNQNNNLVDTNGKEVRKDSKSLTLEETFISPQRFWLLSTMIIKSLEVVCGLSQKTCFHLQSKIVYKTIGFVSHLNENLRNNKTTQKNRFERNDQSTEKTFRKNSDVDKF